MPIRTCLACRAKKEKQALWRFASDGSGIVVGDFFGEHDGRHAYCCKDEKCFKGFLKNKKELSRAFRRQVLGFDEELKNLFGSV